MAAHALLLLLLITAASTAVFSQLNRTPFRTVVENRLNDARGKKLKEICPIDTDPAAARVFDDYGAIFVSRGIALPPTCLFASDADVQQFQSTIKPETITIGGVSIRLQRAAMQALIAARSAAEKRGLSITPRGGSAAAARSYSKTVELWNSRFLPGLKYWTARNRISRKEAETARRAAVSQQVAMVLAWEDEGIYFSQDKKKSILYSVAVPGASQHIFMLALDVEQFADKRVRQILADHGWFQTVRSDLPHFTYLGVAEKDLPSLGLIDLTIGGQKFWIPNVRAVR